GRDVWPGNAGEVDRWVLGTAAGAHPLRGVGVERLADAPVGVLGQLVDRVPLLARHLGAAGRAVPGDALQSGLLRLVAELHRLGARPDLVRRARGPRGVGARAPGGV